MIRLYFLWHYFEWNLLFNNDIRQYRYNKIHLVKLKHSNDFEYNKTSGKSGKDTAVAMSQGLLYRSPISRDPRLLNILDKTQLTCII